MHNKKVFLAKQKIYSKKNTVIGYELLYRNSNRNSFPINIEPTYATLNLINNIFSIGVNKIVQNKFIFINFTKELILNHTPNLLSEKYVVIELLEHIQAENNILKELLKLKQNNYLIALDDIDNENLIEYFSCYIDIYKIDFRKTTYKQRVRILNKIKVINPKAKILAEKISCKEEFNEANLFNYDFYQGFYFDTPIMISKLIHKS